MEKYHVRYQTNKYLRPKKFPLFSTNLSKIKKFTTTIDTLIYVILDVIFGGNSKGQVHQTVSNSNYVSWSTYMIKFK